MTTGSSIYNMVVLVTMENIFFARSVSSEFYRICIIGFCVEAVSDYIYFHFRLPQKFVNFLQQATIGMK